MTGPEPADRQSTPGRERAITRVRRTTAWVVVAATAGTGVAIGLAAHYAPGHSATVQSGSSSRSAESPPAASNTGGGELSPPPVSPSQSSGPSHAVTGQS